MSLPPARSRYLTWLATALARPVDVVTPTQGHAVLGYATGYDAAGIAPFVRSLRAVFDGTVALIVDDRPDVAALLSQHDVIAVAPDMVEGWAPHPVMQRFVAFDRLLRSWPNVDGVLITDVRDVIFQADPFSPWPDRLLAFQEYEAGVLSDHAFNMKYVRALAGDGLAKIVSQQPCICVGTVMGPRADILRLCRAILMLAATPRSAIGGAFGADQAACNLAIHLGMIEAQVLPNYGRVATLGLTEGAKLTFMDGKVVNPDGTISAIVHQHDRHPHLAEAVHDLWCNGLVYRQRVQPKSAAKRLDKLKQSAARRLSELR
ncbi:hypothetical protein [Brevundimonas sp.]